MQIVSKMALTGSAQADFVGWAPSDLFSEIVTFDEKHWYKVGLSKSKILSIRLFGYSPNMGVDRS